MSQEAIILYINKKVVNMTKGKPILIVYYIFFFNSAVCLLSIGILHPVHLSVFYRSRRRSKKLLVFIFSGSKCNNMQKISNLLEFLLPIQHTKSTKIINWFQLNFIILGWYAFQQKHSSTKNKLLYFTVSQNKQRKSRLRTINIFIVIIYIVQQ